MLGGRGLWLWVALLLLVSAPRAFGQACVTCRTEKCPSKVALETWCGSGVDPLAKSAGVKVKVRRKLVAPHTRPVEAPVQGKAPPLKGEAPAQVDPPPVKVAVPAPVEQETPPAAELEKPPTVEPGTPAPVERSVEPTKPALVEPTKPALVEPTKPRDESTLAPSAVMKPPPLSLVPQPRLLKPGGSVMDGKRRPLRIAKWSLLAGGVVLGAVGGVLLALDGRGLCTLQGEATQCERVYDTQAAGIGVMTGSGLSLVASAVLFGLDLRAGRAESAGQVALITVGGHF